MIRSGGRVGCGGGTGGPALPRCAELRGQPTVNRVLRSCDERGVVGSQEQRYRGDFLGSTQPSERDLSQPRVKVTSLSHVLQPGQRVGLAICAGTMAFTRTPNRPFCTASVFVRLRIAAFAGPYATKAPGPAAPPYAAYEDVLMMDPLRWAIMCGIAARIAKTVASNVNRNSSRSNSIGEFLDVVGRDSCGAVVHQDVESAEPLVGLVNQALDLTALADIPWTTLARPPRRSISSTTDRTAASWSELITTVAPSAANLTAHACPIPDPAAVTIATFRWSRPSPNAPLRRHSHDQDRERSASWWTHGFSVRTRGLG